MSRHEHVETLRDERSGLEVTITRSRSADGHMGYSWCIFKTFERNGQVQKSAYKQPQHIEGCLRMIDKLEAWLAKRKGHR